MAIELEISLEWIDFGVQQCFETAVNFKTWS